MSDAINDNEAPEEKKETLLDEQSNQASKKMILLCCVLIISLVIIIAYLIAVSVLDSDDENENEKEEEMKNSFKAKYISKNNSTSIKLFNPVLNNFISSMKIDGVKMNSIHEYNFTKEGEHTVEVVLKEGLNSTEGLFENCEYLKEVDLSKLDISKVVNMKRMFYGCTSLESANLANIDSSNVEEMDMMFHTCINLRKVDFTNFRTLNVKNMTGMFYLCSSLEELDLNSFNTSNVKSMSMMFDSCSSLKKINLDNFDTSKVTDMSYMFSSLAKLESLNLSKFDTKKTKKMNDMFSGCLALKYINLDSFDTSNVEDMGQMFRNCKSISFLNLGNFITDNLLYMEDIFSDCTSLKFINIEKFNTRKSEGKHLFNNLPEDGEIHFNSKLFDILLIKGTNVENWKRINTRTNPEEMTTMQVTKDMGIGINLGNTLEAFGDWIWQWGDHTITSYETAWGSPKITKEMVRGIKNLGFDVMRLPVHWFNMMSENYTINEDLMSRVKEIVDWAMEIELYVILNIHHDERDLFRNMTVTPEKNLKNYKYIWQQIAENFKEYDYYLMFESLNEEACWGDVFNVWSGTDEGKDEVLDLTNQINQVFVDTIRNGGGKNDKRHLLIAGYCTGVEYTCDPMYKMPNDPADRCAVSIHYYNPSTFCIISEDADWGKAQSTWGTEEEIKDLNKNFDLMKTELIDKGIPVIIGEYGSTTENKDINSVRNFLYSICKAAYERNILPILWDTPGGWYDRANARFNDTILLDMLQSVSN